MDIFLSGSRTGPEQALWTAFELLLRRILGSMILPEAAILAHGVPPGPGCGSDASRAARHRRASLRRTVRGSILHQAGWLRNSGRGGLCDGCDSCAEWRDEVYGPGPLRAPARGHPGWRGDPGALRDGLAGRGARARGLPHQLAAA